MSWIRKWRARREGWNRVDQMDLVDELWTVGELLGEDPAAIEETTIRDRVPALVLRLDGEFLVRAAERGIDDELARVWLGDTKGLVERMSSLEEGEVVDLALRLLSLSFVMSKAPTPAEVPPDVLLVEASVSGQEADDA